MGRLEVRQGKKNLPAHIGQCHSLIGDLPWLSRQMVSQLVFFKNIYIIRYVTSNIWIEIQLTTTNYKHLLIKKPDNV